MTKKYDLTTGKPVKCILWFTLPIFIGNLFQQLYNTADTIIVGRTLGNDALAGVGATAAVTFLILGFVSGLTAGFAVMTSQCYGAKNERDVRRSVATSLLLCTVLTVVLTAVSVLGVGPLLRLMRSDPDLYAYSYEYIVMICWGLGATVLYNITSCLVRALGDSKTPLFFLVAAALINVGLDFLFILVFKMGVRGAAAATVVSQGVSGLACLIYMFCRFPILRIGRADFRVKPRFVWRHLAIGLPMAFQFSITAIGVMIQQTALNTLGKAAITAYSAANKIENLAIQIFVSLGTTMATYCGQNYGAGRYDRIRRGMNGGALICLCAVGLVTAFVCLLGGVMTKLFMRDATEEIVWLSRKYLLFQGVFYPFLGAIFLYRNALQGMGRSTVTMLAGAIELLMRVLASFVLVAYLRFTGICLSNPVAWIGAAVFLVITYYIVMHRSKDKVPVPVGNAATANESEKEIEDARN